MKSVSHRRVICAALLVLFLTTLVGGRAGLSAEFRSHAPMRPLAEASQRPKSDGPAKFVDAAQGDDDNDGSEVKPWRTVNHALPQLVPGDTLYLRGGSYFENVYCAVAGTKEKPITIRSYPGELATIDGGYPEFQT